MYTSIAVPLDGSAFAKRALPAALALARRSDAAVHLVHVHEPITYVGNAPMYDTRLDNELRQEMRSELTALAAQLDRETSLRVEAAFLDGPVVSTLQRYLSDRRPDLVVMMTHGRGGLARAWLGSVADGVVREAWSPVLLVRPGAEWPSELAEPLFRHVLVPLDGSAAAAAVLDDVVGLGTPDATLYTLLTVVVPLPFLVHPAAAAEPLFDDRSDVEGQREAALAQLRRAAADLRESGARIETRVVVHRRPAEGILEYAEAQHADAIALSTHGHGAPGRLFLGSVADKIVRGASVPVLLRRAARVGEA